MKNYMKNPLLLTFLFAALLVACNESPDDSKERAKEANKERFEDSNMKDDAEFAVHATDGSLFEVRASELAQSKATNPKVKDVAQKIVQDHKKANDRLKEIASQKDIQLPTAISEDKQDEYEDLAETDGENFDEKYVDKMIDAHEKMLDKFRDHEEEANDPDIQNWVSQQIPTLEQHLDRLKQVRDSNNGNNNMSMSGDNDNGTSMDGENVGLSHNDEETTRAAENAGEDPNSKVMQDRQLDNEDEMNTADENGR